MNNHDDRIQPRAGVLGTSLLVMMLVASPLAGENLKIFGSEHPPYSYLKDGRPTGLCADIVRALLDDLDLQQEITIAPWARSYKTALEEPNVLLFTVARTTEREPLFHWVGVIVSGATHLYGLRDRNDIVINRLDQAQRYKIGVVRDDIRAAFLRKNGFTDLDEVTGSEINARKLAMGWIDLWVEEEHAAPFVFEKIGLNPGEKLKNSTPLISALTATSPFPATPIRSWWQDFKPPWIASRTQGSIRVSSPPTTPCPTLDRTAGARYNPASHFPSPFPAPPCPMSLFTYCSLVLTMLLWGGTFIAGRILAETMEPAGAAFLRFAIASLAMMAAVPLLEGRIKLPPRRLWLSLFLLGLTGVFAYNVFFFHGLQYISAGRASLIVAGTPLVITLFAALFLRERLTAIKVGGVLLSLAGAVVVIGNGDPATLFSGGFGRGEQALLGCVLSWSAYSLIGRRVLQTLPPLTAVCYSTLIGTLLLAIPAAGTGIFTRLNAISPLSWLSLVYLGLGGTALAFSLYYMAIKRIGAARAGIFINLVPVFSLLLAWLLLGETIKPAVLAGGVLVLAGVSLANYQRR